MWIDEFFEIEESTCVCVCTCVKGGVLLRLLDFLKVYDCGGKSYCRLDDIDTFVRVRIVFVFFSRSVLLDVVFVFLFWFLFGVRFITGF